MKKLLRTFPLLFITLLFACADTGNNEEIDLILKYNPGDTQTITYRESATSKLVELKNEMQILFKVSSIDPDGSTYHFEVDLLEVSTESGKGDDMESYNSKQDFTQMNSEQRLMHIEFKPYLQNLLTISIDKKGHVVEPFELLTDMPLHENEPLIEMSQVQIPFPDHKVSEGSKWSSSFDRDDLIPVHRDSEFTVEEISADEIIISVESEIESMVGPNTMTGKYILNRENCQLKSANLEMPSMMGGKISYRITAE